MADAATPKKEPKTPKEQLRDDLAEQLATFVSLDVDKSTFITKAEIANAVIDQFKTQNGGQAGEEKLKDYITKAIALREEVEQSQSQSVNSPRARLIKEIVAPVMGVNGKAGTNEPLSKEYLKLRLEDYAKESKKTLSPLDVEQTAQEIADGVKYAQWAERNLQRIFSDLKRGLDDNLSLSGPLAGDISSQKAQAKQLAAEIESQNRMVTPDEVAATVGGRPATAAESDVIRKIVTPILDQAKASAPPSGSELALKKLGLDIKQNEAIAAVRTEMAKYSLSCTAIEKGVTVEDMAQALGLRPAKNNEEVMTCRK